MATFAGKQAGYADPTMREESVLDAATQTYTFKGKQPNAAAPTVIGIIAPLWKVRESARELYQLPNGDWS